MSDIAQFRYLCPLLTPPLISRRSLVPSVQSMSQRVTDPTATVREHLGHVLVEVSRLLIKFLEMLKLNNLG